MDYKKNYEDALETARKLNSGEGVASPPGWTVCEVIFPELKESEDEKIIKAIIAHIKDMRYYDNYYDVTPDEMIAWLEKQVPKPKWSEEDENIMRGAISFLIEFKDKGYENAVACIDWLKSIKQRMEEQQ